MDRVTPKLKWIQHEGKLAECLVEPERNAMLDRAICPLVDSNKSLVEIVETLDERGDISLEEWVSIAFALGYFAAYRGH